MKLIAWVVLSATLSGTSGCATSKVGNFCDVASPIRPSKADVVTDGTKIQIIKHNKYGADHCGWV